MFKKAASLILCMVLLFSMIPANPDNAEAASKETAKILNDTLNIRKGPGLSYGIEAIAKKNETYPVLERKKEWVKLSLPGNRTGWAASWLVQIQSSSKTKMVSTKSSDLRIRKGPGTGYSVVGTFPAGKQAAVLKTEGDWTNISYNGVKGWISTRYIEASSGSSAEKTQPASGPTGYITAASLNVRSAPNPAASMLGSVKKGTPVTILKTEGSWHRISYSGKTGWVSKEYVKSSVSENKAETSGTVTASSLNVRSAPSLNGRLSGKVMKNEKVQILEEKSSWSRIRYNGSQTGWVSSLYLKKQGESSGKEAAGKTSGSIRLTANGTNIRSNPSVNSQILARGTAGQTFKVLGVQNDWYKISLSGGKTGYVAGWLAEDTTYGKMISTPGQQAALKGKTIVVDPGHGGIDGGAKGAGGTLEKHLTLKSANTLKGRLQAEGANVILTRSSDLYISLSSRVTTARVKAADAFLSLHYDSNLNKTVKGMTFFYYHSSGQKLASSLQNELIRKTGLKDRGVKFGDFHVLRNNNRPAALIELGFLSSASEEMNVNSSSFQQNAATGITEGLKNYFK
ncbi:SH3 domain-containing protein [Metabacillus sp. 84]|uniref:SH3 domain-containing protein n=1 Tax=Metabacillus sp. 84 TaxID=3404705 RepID=UPI003CF6344F